MKNFSEYNFLSNIHITIFYTQIYLLYMFSILDRKKKIEIFFQPRHPKISSIDKLFPFLLKSRNFTFLYQVKYFTHFTFPSAHTNKLRKVTEFRSIFWRNSRLFYKVHIQRPYDQHTFMTVECKMGQQNLVRNTVCYTNEKRGFKKKKQKKQWNTKG